jgi:hypothetical protein
MPDPVFHLVERAIGIVSGLAAVEPDPRAGERDAARHGAARRDRAGAAAAGSARVHDR